MSLESWWQEITGGVVLGVLTFLGGRAVKRVDATAEKVDKLEQNCVTREELAGLVRKLDEREQAASVHRQRIYDRLDENLKQQHEFNLRVAERMGGK